MLKRILSTLLAAVMLASGVWAESSVEESAGATFPTPARFHDDEYQKLVAFALQYDNLEVLGWDLANPSSWAGITWRNFEPRRVGNISLAAARYTYGNDSYGMPEPIRLPNRKPLEGVLDVSNFLALDSIDVSENLLVELNVAGCVSLRLVNCEKNLITELDVSDSPLYYLYCNDNQIKKLDLSQQIMLGSLQCQNNSLNELILPTPHRTDIYIECSNNRLQDISIFDSILSFGRLKIDNNFFDLSDSDIESIKSRSRLDERVDNFIYLPQLAPPPPRLPTCCATCCFYYCDEARHLYCTCCANCRGISGLDTRGGRCVCSRRGCSGCFCRSNLIATPHYECDVPDCYICVPLLFGDVDGDGVLSFNDVYQTLAFTIGEPTVIVAPMGWSRFPNNAFYAAVPCGESVELWRGLQLHRRLLGMSTTYDDWDFVLPIKVDVGFTRIAVHAEICNTHELVKYYTDSEIPADTQISFVRGQRQSVEFNPSASGRMIHEEGFVFRRGEMVHSVHSGANGAKDIILARTFENQSLPADTWLLFCRNIAREVVVDNYVLSVKNCTREECCLCKCGDCEDCGVFRHDLSSQNLTDTDLGELLVSRKVPQNTTHLNLSGNKIRNYALLKLLPNLRELDISDNPIFDEHIDEIQALLPNVAITHNARPVPPLPPDLSQATMADALAILRHIVDLPTEIEVTVATHDYDGDGKIDIVDALLVLRRLISTRLAYQAMGFIFPTETGTRSRGYSPTHPAITIAAPRGTNIFAVADGEVVLSQLNYYSYGHTVIIQHESGLQTLYAHCFSLLVEEGEFVKQGQVIATLGRTNTRMSPYLYFQVIDTSENMRRMLNPEWFFNW